MNVHEFLAARVEEMRALARGPVRAADPDAWQALRRDADALMVVLKVHFPTEVGACQGCGLDYIGVSEVENLDFCTTLRALAWRWHRHRDWQQAWTVPVSMDVSTWPPSENCYCGGPGELYAHREGTGRHCRERHGRP